MIGNLIWNTKSASFSGLGGGEVVVTRVRTTWHFEACFLISWHFNASWEKGQRFLPVLIDFHFRKHSFFLTLLTSCWGVWWGMSLVFRESSGRHRACRCASRATSAADTFNSLKELHCKLGGSACKYKAVQRRGEPWDLIFPIFTPPGIPLSQFTLGRRALAVPNPSVDTISLIPSSRGSPVPAGLCQSWACWI